MRMKETFFQIDPNQCRSCMMAFSVERPYRQFATDMMKEEGILSIEQAFGSLRDPRSHTPAHRLTDMLVLALCAILSGRP